MANAQTPFGLRPVRMYNGSPYTGQTIRAYLHASEAVALYIGDPLEPQTATAYMDPTGKHPTFKLSTGATAHSVVAVIASFDPDPDNLTLQYRKASTARYANVILTKDVVFQIRGDGAGTPTKIYPGQNFTMTAGTASTITGLSGYQLAETTPATTEAHPLHILNLADIEDNELDDYAVWDVVVSACQDVTGTWLGVTPA